MLTKNEITSLSLSPTKKDFVQIWNELLEVAGKLSERWDPTSTNESDPGIVILKALTGIADKLNYNIDKNTLEAFMPTAAQEDSMRKLCEMLGYNLKYYQSAETNVTIKYHNTEPTPTETNVMTAPGLEIPKFTVITNGDGDVNYFTVNEDVRYISAEAPITDPPIPCMEGQLVKCESINDNGVITVNQLSESNRFYLPEVQVAENGIFVYNIFSNGFDGRLVDGTVWKKVDNLNIQVLGSRVYKFGFDSYEGRPYIEFPEDASELFNDGIFIYYTRTNGVNGNVSSRVLTQLELPNLSGWSDVSAESFSVENVFAATSGSNAETIKQAYNNFKKTIGTFDTLVTCRDYMNKIYSMVNELNKPYVSNILVTDIRNDLNRANTICSCDGAGIFYKETPLFTGSTETTSNVSYTSTVAGSPTENRTEGELEYTRTVPGEETLSKIVPGEETLISKEEGVIGDTPYFTSDPVESEEDGEAVTIEFDFNKPYFDTTEEVWRYGGRSGGETLYTQDIDDGLTDDKYPGYTKRSDFDDNKPGIHVDGTDTDENGVGTGINKDGKKCWTIDQVNVEGNIVTFYTNILVPKTEYTPKVKTRTVTERYLRVDEAHYERTNEKHFKQTDTAYYTQTNTITRERIDKETTEKITTTTVKDDYAIDHFDLVLYPFKSYNQIKDSFKDISKLYDASFTYDPSSFEEIKARLEEESLKTIAHNIVKPVAGNTISINNYLRLSATIATNSKITVEEGEKIIDNIKRALANAFNMRELDFGEEIPFDSIIEVIEKADARIRVASLNEPDLYTTFTVLDHYEKNGTPILTEYAVSQPKLTKEEAYATGRFGTKENGTFDVTKAKEIYNKLAVRNVLAGRVPLFNYNETFKTSFFEGAYQETVQIDTNIPENLPVPDENTPYTIWVDEDGTIYTGVFEKGDTPETDKRTYYKTGTPEDFDDIVKDNLITTEQEAITDIKADCQIKTDQAGSKIITDVTLADGEFVKFRAPNFSTLKTYPAFVNYHLALNKEFLSTSANASASTLFDLLDKDRSDWSLEKRDIGWQKVLNYFEDIDKSMSDTKDKPKYKKTFSLSQTISRYTPVAETDKDLCNGDSETGLHVLDNLDGKHCKYCGTLMIDSVQKGPAVVTLDNSDHIENSDMIRELLTESGCVKLTNEVVYDNDLGTYAAIATLKWDDSDPNRNKVSGTGPALNIRLALGKDCTSSNPFITDSDVFYDIQVAINKKLEELRGMTADKNGTPVLPTECAWTLSFNFECVPFDAVSLAEWERFVKLRSNNTLFGFNPIEENGTIFWRAYGEGYPVGQYILQNSEKLLEFNKDYFNSLPEMRLRGIYVAEYLGKNAAPMVITNNEEYSLRANEYLYIEYTPSTSSEDGTTQESDAVTEIYGPGTIIRPSGFEGGLKDTTVNIANGNSAFKNVTFKSPINSGNITLGMHRFGANEQVEIRDFARVELTKDSFKANPAVYVYKNFDCDTLESAGDNRTYTLKDGEYIFYTDQAKAELAYFTSGTQVTLTGALKIPKSDTIDIATILDSGIQEIPWGSPLAFTDNDKLIFQEFQYITLGPKDTLKKVALTEQAGFLDSDWQYCDNIEYCLAGSGDVYTLSPINVSTAQVDTVKGNGWEASSTLELNVSPNKAQKLRHTDKVQNSLTVTSTNSGGGGTRSRTISPSNAANPISFKTNLACYASGNQINIKDVYSNPNGLNSFTLKVFADDEPTIVKTEPGRVVPWYQNKVTDIANWKTENLDDAFSAKSYNELWSSLDLNKITACDESNADAEYDCALKLPISVLPNTYGIFSIYLNYANDKDNQSAKTWIEILPGTSRADVTLLNVSEDELKTRWEIAPVGSNKPDKLFLHPGINCIRVNKTSKIFIKTSAASQGTLYFDELRLVDCLPVKYNEIADDGTLVPITLSTQGLNLKQLGYLSTANSSDIDYTDKDVRSKLKTGCIDKAYAGLNTEVAKANKDYSSIYAEVTKLKPKVQKLIDTQKALKKDLDYVRGIKPQNLEALLTVYQNVSSALNKEQALLEAFDSHKTVENSDQLLVQLLENLTATEVGQQQLKQELQALLAKTRTDTETFDEETILADFEDCSATDKGLSAFNKIILVTAEKLEEAYNKQLDDLAGSLERVDNLEERNRLLAVLNKLLIEKNADNQAQLTTLINKLKDIVEHEDINNYLAEMREASQLEEYIRLESIASQVLSSVSADDIELLISEIQRVASENNISQLKTLVTSALSLFNPDSSADQDYTNMKTELGALITYLQENAGNITSGNVITLTNNAAKAVETFYQNYPKTILEDIKVVLDTMSTITNGDLSQILQSIEELHNSKDEQIITIVEQLQSVLDQYTLDIGALESLSIDSWVHTDIVEYVQKAIIEVWPEYMTTSIEAFIEQIDSGFTKAINLKLDSLEAILTRATLTTIIDDTLTLTLQDVIDIDAFYALFEKIKYLLDNNSQNIANIELINLISTSISLPQEISSAMEAISIDSTERNNTLVQILNELATSGSDVSAAKRQQLIKSLKTELNNTKRLDEQLLTVISSTLYPSIVKFEKEPEASDDFYAELNSALHKIKNAILANNLDSAESHMFLDDQILEVFNTKAEDFKATLLNFNFDSASQLPKSFKENVSKLKETVEIQNEITVIKESQLDTLDSAAISNLENYLINKQILKDILAVLATELKKIEDAAMKVDEKFTEAYKTLLLEEQLLNEIRNTDKKREFFYNVPIEPSLAIDFNEGNDALNTLMNPLMNYDINNINNNFVISKLDIDYLTTGIQIARSSRLN